MEPIQIPIEDVLDLHTFRPKDIADLLENYFDECIKADIFSVRVIHGKGKGVLRERVYSLLRRHPRQVHQAAQAPRDRGARHLRRRMSRRTSPHRRALLAAGTVAAIGIDRRLRRSHRA